MSLEIVRRIRGNVHGTIDVSELEDVVMNHEYVQRLRRIKQLAFLSLVFPGASHTRFEHSLGVMQLAGVAWEKLHANQKRLAVSMAKSPDFATVEKQGGKKGRHGLLAPTLPLVKVIFENDYALQTLRLAALLHDVGHPAFSHSGERFMPSWTTVAEENKSAPEYLRDYLGKRIKKMREQGKDPSKVPVRHEVYSLLMIDRLLTDTYARYPNLPLKVKPQDLAAVITWDIEPSEGSPIKPHGIYKLLHELISGELDIDRMDYLLRDSKECGVVYGIFDAGRIFDSLSLYFSETDESVHVAINFSGLAAFEDYLRARYSMYLQLYFHKTGSAAEAMLQHLADKLDNWRLPADLKSYARIDEYNIGAQLEAAAKAKKWNKKQYDEFESLLRGALYDRRLWKRVYELSGTEGKKVDMKLLERAKGVLLKMQVPFEQISSENSLTRFRPRTDPDAASQNYLRLIKKDVRQFPRVVAIEDYSQLIDNNSGTAIHRLYVADDVDSQGRSIPQQIKRAIVEELQNVK